MTTNKKKYNEFPLLLQKWRTLKEVIYILKIPYDATLALQNRKLTLSDTYGIWLEAKLPLTQLIGAKKSKSELDINLLKGLTDRNEHIFDHPAMKAALYLDPRYRYAVTRSPQLIDEAKEFIMKIQRRLNYFKNQALIENNVNEMSSDSNDSIGIEFDAQAAINNYLNYSTTNQNISSNAVSDLEMELESFDPPKLEIKDSILEYWHKSDDDNSLRDVANAIFSIPPTETQVERDFSALKFIRNSL